jgi:exosome complex RNA-binding protein Rrp42 (RNase PH superfamily)
LINNDGNFLDAMNFAALACILRFKHNFVVAENNQLRVYSSTEKARKVFSLNHLPFLFSFGILNENQSVSEEGEDYVIFDPLVSL